jgi:hypothetical protein
MRCNHWSECPASIKPCNAIHHDYAEVHISYFVSFSIVFVSAQPSGERFTNLANSVYFNILTNNPDTSVKHFFKKYATYPIEEIRRGWTDYPPVTIQRRISIHSYLFANHSFLPSIFNEGKFDVTILDSDGYIDILNLEVRFDFDNIDSAKQAFSYFVNRFSALTNNKQVLSAGNTENAVFINDQSKFMADKVQIVLTKERLFDYGYILYFRFSKNYD